VYAVGSPNFLHEHHGALEMAKRICQGELGDVQMLVRPHPIHDNSEMIELFRPYAPRVVLQQTAEAGTELTARSQDESHIVEWVNTFRHADVVVNLSSTVTVDAAIFDRPVVNLDFDPEPGQPNQALVKDVNHLWTHFKPIAESGGVWLVNDWEELTMAVKTYLRQPELHREKRRWIAEYVCGYTDGKCGERMAQAVLDFVGRTQNIGANGSNRRVASTW
jgi:CDP-glycerol glycerophosphotransferase (TagB/SpsB family)